MPPTADSTDESSEHGEAVWSSLGARHRGGAALPAEARQGLPPPCRRVAAGRGRAHRRRRPRGRLQRQPAHHLAESPAALRPALWPTTRDRALPRARGFAKVALRTQLSIRALGRRFPAARAPPSCITRPTNWRLLPPDDRVGRCPGHGGGLCACGSVPKGRCPAAAAAPVPRGWREYRPVGMDGRELRVAFSPGRYRGGGPPSLTLKRPPPHPRCRLYPVIPLPVSRHGTQ